MKNKGYTLLELVMVISLLAIVLLGGTAVFYQNLRSNGLGNVDMSLNTELRSVLSVIEKDIRFSTVKGVGAFVRDDCLNAGANGVNGDTLFVVDLQGNGMSYALDSGRIASRSAAAVNTAYLTGVAFEVTDLTFTWYCHSGVSDKINVAIKMKSTVLGSGINIDRSVSREINLFNSGLN